MQKIISYNVAGLRPRVPLVERILVQESPDFLLLQEIKTTSETFPFTAFEKYGYYLSFVGQKSFNGVALFSKEKPNDVITMLPDTYENEPQARFIETRFNNCLSVISVYIPNGNPPEKDPLDTSRLIYKLNWMNALKKYISTLKDTGQSVIIGGDFNVIASDTDVYNPEAYRTNALMVPPVRRAFEDFSKIGLINTLRYKTNETHLYSFWDFQMGAWPKNYGMLLDYIFVSSDLESRLTDSVILKNYRGFNKPSDHVPVCCILA